MTGTQVADDHASRKKRETNDGDEENDVARIQNAFLESVKVRNDTERGDDIHQRSRRPADEDSPVALGDMIGHYKRSKFMAEQIAMELKAEAEGENVRPNSQGGNQAENGEYKTAATDAPQTQQGPDSVGIKRMNSGLAKRQTELKKDGIAGEKGMQNLGFKDGKVECTSKLRHVRTGDEMFDGGQRPERRIVAASREARRAAHDHRAQCRNDLRLNPLA